MYKEKKYIMDKLITFLNNELESKYLSFHAVDFNGNEADLIVKENSTLFKEYVENKEYIQLDVEELLDKRLFDNKNEIIIFDLNANEDYTDLDYIKESLKYPYLSYSNEIKGILNSFINYVIEKNV